MTEKIINKDDSRNWQANILLDNAKRLEQERDELKKTVENQKLEYEELQCDLSVVEDVCECLKSENAELKQENKELKEKAPMKLIAKNTKYRSALEEIRDYVQNQVKHYESVEHIEAMCDWQDVLDKINEVLNS